jgi:hypothetical protein
MFENMGHTSLAPFMWEAKPKQRTGFYKSEVNKNKLNELPRRQESRAPQQEKKGDTIAIPCRGFRKRCGMDKGQNVNWAVVYGTSASTQW